jgi:hypothetical protein
MTTDPGAIHYRVEGGRTCIDIRVRDVQQLFDNRDPAPFRERDLDEDAVDYIIAAAEEIPARHPLKIVLTIDVVPPEGLGPPDIAHAIRAHFQRELTQVRRRIRNQRRTGQAILGFGVVVLVFCLSLAQFTQQLPQSAVRDIVREGLIIIGWVAIWRPIEGLLFDWWPLVQQRRHVARLLDADILVSPTAGLPR